MPTLVLDPPPPEIAELIERRRRLGLDRYDELWEGTYHMAPAPSSRHGRLEHRLIALLRPAADAAGLVGTGAFNLGQAGDFRVPDTGYCRPGGDPDAVYLQTAALVVEIVSPGDETYEKLPFYARHGVDEVLVVEPEHRRVRLYGRVGDGYAERPSSTVLGIETARIADQLDWT